MKVNFNIFVFGRREHYELISRVWLLRDVRSIYSIPFPIQPTKSTSVYFFSPKFANVSCYDITPGSKYVIPWKKMKLFGASWWTQQLMEDTHNFALNTSTKDFIQNETSDHINEISNPDNSNNNYNHSKSPSQHSFFINTELKLRVPLEMVENCHEQIDEKNGEQNDQILEKDLQDDFFQVHQDGSILLAPLFRRNLPQSHLDNQPKFISNHLLYNSPRCGLFLHHCVPKASSHIINILPHVHSWKAHPENITSYYEPSEHTAASVLHNYGDTPFSSNLYPFCIIPIDLCDEASINIAIWAYHTLLYQYNNNFFLPQPHTKVIVMLFNRVAYDMHIIREAQIHEWFQNFPLEVQYLFYPTMFHLPPTTEIDNDIRTISTLQNSNAPLTTKTVLASKDATVPCTFTFDPHYLEQESANIDLATQLDQGFIAQIQKYFLHAIFCSSRFDSSTNPNILLPRPFIQSAIRYPLRSMIGKPIKLGITENKKHVPFFVPNDMKHWCLFDKYDQDPINKYDRSIACGVPVLTSRSTSLQSLHHNLSSQVTMFADSIISPALIQARQDIALSAIFPETLETRYPESYNTRLSFHHCTHLRLKYFPFIRMNSGDSVSPWTPESILKEIGTDVFDLLTVPFSITNPMNPTSLSQQSHQMVPPHHRFLSSLSPPLETSFHLIQQRPQLISPTHHYDLTLKESTDNMAIDHFSTLSIEPIHQYATPYFLSSSLYNSSVDQLNPIDCDQISALTSTSSTSSTSPTSPISPPSPTAKINPITTIYHSHARLDRYYSTMYIDSEIQQILAQEKASLLMNSDLEDSPLLTNYPQQTLRTLSQLFTSSIISSSELTSAPSPLEASQLPNQSTEFTSSSTDEFKTPIISPLSTTPHHFHIQFDPVPDTTNYQPTPNTPFLIPYHSLLTFTVVDLTDLISQVKIIESIRECSLWRPTLLSHLANLWRKQAQIDFRYTIQSMVNAFAPRNDNESSQPVQVPSQSYPNQLLSPSHTNNSLIINTDSKPKTQLHTVITSTFDTPTYTQLVQLVSKDYQRMVPPSTYTLYSLRNGNHNTTDRNVLPHFLIVIDNCAQDPDKLNTYNESFATYSDLNRPAFISKEAAIMQSYLSQLVPLAAGARDGKYPLHYSFTTLKQLKRRMVECIQLAIAMRMDNYDFNSNSSQKM